MEEVLKRSRNQKSPSEIEIVDLDEVVEFYNRHFPKSQHSREFKPGIYSDESRQPVVLCVKDNGEIVGLLEAWNNQDNPDQKVLATIAIDPGYRRLGYAKKLFEQARAIVAQSGLAQNWIVHFRDENKDMLDPMYASWGFKELTQAKTSYSNGETKWKMVMKSAELPHSNPQQYINGQTLYPQTNIPSPSLG